MIKIVYSYSYEVPDILVRLWRNLNFLDIFSKKKYSINFHANPSSGSRLLRADRRTDRHNEANFAKHLKMVQIVNNTGSGIAQLVYWPGYEMWDPGFDSGKSRSFFSGIQNVQNDSPPFDFSLLFNEFRGSFLEGTTNGVWRWPLTSVECRV
jgi:hypothetical protein